MTKSVQNVIAEDTWCNLSEDYEGMTDVSKVRVYEEGGRFFLEATCNDVEVLAEVSKVETVDLSPLNRGWPVSDHLPDVAEHLGLTLLS